MDNVRVPNRRTADVFPNATASDIVFRVGLVLTVVAIGLISLCESYTASKT